MFRIRWESKINGCQGLSESAFPLELANDICEDLNSDCGNGIHHQVELNEWHSRWGLIVRLPQDGQEPSPLWQMN